MDAEQEFTIIGMPAIAGSWTIGGPAGLRIYMKQRPRWLTRLMTRWLMEWVWEDAPTRS